jgi:hypothetical protein
MAYTEVMQKRIYTDMDQLRAGHAQLALAMNPELFLTLATNQSMSLERMQKLTRRFLLLMDRQLLGGQYFKFASDRRMDGLFYVEHENSNIHVHDDSGHCRQRHGWWSWFGCCAPTFPASVGLSGH